MTNSQRLDVIRKALTLWIRQHKGVEDTESELERFRESLLIRDGFFCGRRLETDDYCAVWFMEEDALKIQSADSREVLAQLQGEDIDRVTAPRMTIIALPQLPSQQTTDPVPQKRAA